MGSVGRAKKTPQEALKEAAGKGGAHETKAVIASGPSGSGKTSWAQWFVKRRSALGERWVVIGRHECRVEALEKAGTPADQMRAALAAWDYKPQSAGERKVTGRCAALLKGALKGKATGVILTDVNAHDGGLSSVLRLLSNGFKSELIHLKRFEAPLEELLRRDGERGALSVGEKVIRSQVKRLKAFDDLAASRALALKQTQERSAALAGSSARVQKP